MAQNDREMPSTTSLMASILSAKNGWVLAYMARRRIILKKDEEV